MSNRFFPRSVPKSLPVALTAALMVFLAGGARAGASSGTDHPPAGPPAEDAAASAPAPTRVLDVASLVDLDRLIERIADRRVIFVGETHDNYADHLNQLEIIRRLHALGKPLAIGLEFFQQPFQPVLDAYIAGAISEAEMLKQSGYFDRWRFDYRLYRPILRYAREQRIPLIALNIPSELIAKVGAGGLESLTAAERAGLPAELHGSDPAYRARIKAVFDYHPQAADADFERFLAVQLLWDEGMAERAARYLGEHPDTTLVVLAGSGHIEFGQGVPRRIERRLDVSTAILLNGGSAALDPGRADFLLFPPDVELPSSGLLGVMLDTEFEGQGMRIQGFAPESGAKSAGLAVDDRLIEIDGVGIQDYADVRLAMMDASPGDRLPVVALRPGLLGKPERLEFEVELH